MIDSEIDDSPTLLNEEIKEETEGNLFDVGTNKEFKLTADLTNRKQWTLYGDVELDSKNEKIIRWSMDPALNKVNISTNSEIDLSIPKEVAWLNDKKSSVWSHVEYLRDTTIEDLEHQLSKDAHTFLEYDRSMNHLHSNILHILQHTSEGDIAIRLYSRELMDEIVRTSMLEVVEEVLQLRTKAFNTVTRIFLKGIMDINLETERLLKLSGRLTLVQGAVRDFISNRNDLLCTKEQTERNNNQRIIFKRIRDAIRQKVPFTPHHIELQTSANLIMDTTSHNRSLLLQPSIDRESEFYLGIRNDHINVEFMHQIIPSAISAVAFFDHYHQHYHLHKQHHHYQQQNKGRANVSPRKTHSGDDANYNFHDLAQEETILIAGHENGTISLWRLLFNKRLKPHPPIFLAANNRGISTSSNNNTPTTGIRDIQLHPLDPYCVLVTQEDGEVSWFRVRLSTFDYYYGDLESVEEESPSNSPQKRNQQLVVQSKRSGGLLSLLLQCFRRSKPSVSNSIPSLEAKKNRAEGTGIMNSNGKEILKKQFSALNQIVSFVPEDLPYDPPNLPEDRFWQEEDKKKQLLQRYYKELLNSSNNTSSWFGGSKSNDLSDGNDVGKVQRGHLEEKYDKEYSKLLIHPYQRADYRPRPVLACFHPAINRMTSATSLMIAATSGDVYKFNVDMILADMTNATLKEEKKRNENNFALSVSFKQFPDEKPSASSIIQQWRLMPPYDATSLHVTEEFVLPQQAPSGFLLKNPHFENNDNKNSNQPSGSPRKQRKQLANRAKLPGRSHVFREILHFHRATHSIPATMDGKLEQFFLRYPALRSVFTGHAKPLPSTNMAAASLLLFLQNQHRILLISPLQSSCFNPFFAPSDKNKYHHKRHHQQEETSSAAGWNMDSLISVDSAGCIALWRTQEEAGYQHCHWHVPRISLQLETLLSSSGHKGKQHQQQHSTSFIQIFENVNNRKIYFVNHPFTMNTDVVRQEDEKFHLKNNKKAKRKTNHKLSRWQQFLRQQHIQLRVQQRSLLSTASDQKKSNSFVKDSIQQMWARLKATSTDNVDALTCPERWVHTEFSPVFLSQPPPVMFAFDGIKTPDKAENDVSNLADSNDANHENKHIRNSNSDSVPPVATNESVPRESFWKFHKLQLVSELEAAPSTADPFDDDDDVPLNSAKEMATVWLAEEMKPVRYEYMIVMAKVSDDKEVLSLLLHCVEDTFPSKTQAQSTQQHWRLVVLHLRELQLSPVHIVISPPALDANDKVNKNKSHIDHIHAVPYVRDFAVSSVFVETAGHGRLVAVLVNHTAREDTKDTVKATCSLRFFSTLTGEEVILPLHGNSSKDKDFLCHGDWHRIQWCPSFRYLALYTSPVYTSFTARHHGSKTKHQSLDPLYDTHFIEYYYYLRGLRYDEEDTDTNVLLQKWFQQGNIEQLPSFVNPQPSSSVDNNNKLKRPHPVSQGPAPPMQLIRLRHILDRDLLALSQWQSISNNETDQSSSSSSLSSLQEDPLRYLRHLGTNLRKSETLYQTKLPQDETSLIPAIEDDTEEEASSRTSMLTTKACLPFLLKPLPDELTSLTDSEEEDPSMPLTTGAAGSVSGKVYQRKQHHDLWQRELTLSVQTWVLECVEDALRIVEIHAKAKRSEQLLADLFLTTAEHSRTTNNKQTRRSNPDDSKKTAIPEMQYGGIPPTRWPVPETITAAVEAVLAERREYYERLYRRVLAREKKRSQALSHPQANTAVHHANDADELIPVVEQGEK